ncbi:metal-dependent transcriptional regulator [Desulfobaculum senezii]
MSENAPVLTSTQEDYLESIFKLEETLGAARSRDIADDLGVSRSSVTSALKGLAARGLIEYEPYSLVRLTESGAVIARDIAHRHFILNEFFHRVLQLEPGHADAVACKVEHAVDAAVIKRLGQFVLYIERSDLPWEHWQDEYARIMAQDPHPGKRDEDES